MTTLSLTTFTTNTVLTTNILLITLAVIVVVALAMSKWFDCQADNKTVAPLVAMVRLDMTDLSLSMKEWDLLRASNDIKPL